MRLPFNMGLPHNMRLPLKPRLPQNMRLPFYMRLPRCIRQPLMELPHIIPLDLNSKVTEKLVYLPLKVRNY